MNVSTLIYSIREDWPEQTAQVKRDRRRVMRVIILLAVTIGPGVALVEYLLPKTAVAWRSFLAEALSMCLYAAVAVWYGLRQQPRLARRVAVMVYLIGLAIMGLVDLSTKGGVSELLVNSRRANEPILWAGVLMLAFLPLLGLVAWRYPTKMSRVGLSLVRPISRHSLDWSLAETQPQPARRSLGPYLLAGLSVGLLIGFHFWLTAKTAGIDFDVKPWPYMAWQFFYEVGPQSLPEELFMRGVVFNELFFGRAWNFWKAALATAGLELLSLLVKQDYGREILIVVGVVFYTVVSSVASAGLFRWSRSVLPGYISNVVFGVVSLFR